MKATNVLFLWAICLTLQFSCTHISREDSSAAGKQISQMNLEKTASAIHEEVGDAQADDASFCDTIQIGSKPCGGPWGYLVFSNQTSDKTLLQKLVERYNTLDDIRNKEEERFSTCEMAMEPNVQLENGACRSNEEYAWNPGDILKRNGISSNRK